jgi:hypothetical protein
LPFPGIPELIILFSPPIVWSEPELQASIKYTVQKAEQTTTMPSIRQSWTVISGPLAAVVAGLIFIRIGYHHPTHAATTEDVSTFLTTRNTTLSIDGHINPLDIYAPFFNAYSPILQLGETKHDRPGQNAGMARASMGGLEDNSALGAWNLVLPQKRAQAKCSPTSMDSYVSHPKLATARRERLCKTLQRKPTCTGAGQAHTAHLLTGSLEFTLWRSGTIRILHAVQHLKIISANNISADGSTVPIVAAHEQRQKTARAPVHRHVEEGGPCHLHSINGKTRRALTRCRHNSSSLAAHLRKLDRHCDQATISLSRPRDDAQNPVPLEHFVTRPAPMVPIESMTSNVGNYIAALDTVCMYGACPPPFPLPPPTPPPVVFSDATQSVPFGNLLKNFRQSARGLL